MNCWVGVCHRDTETLILSAAHTHSVHTMGVRPPGFELFCIHESRLANALFCILDIWLDFIHVVVLPLFSSGINFHCNKHITNY